jgi:hypothetical protein
MASLNKKVIVVDIDISLPNLDQYTPEKPILFSRFSILPMTFSDEVLLIVNPDPASKSDTQKAAHSIKTKIILFKSNNGNSKKNIWSTRQKRIFSEAF